MKWEYSDVMAYLEDKIIYEEATDKEIEIYNMGIYSGELSKGLINKLNEQIRKEF